MSEGEPGFWRSFRWRAAGASASVVALAIIGLLVIYHWEPNGTATGRLNPLLFSALQTALTTILSIGSISLIFEVLLRESYGRDLRRFLRLRTALVTSGLQDIQASPHVNWAEVFVGASKITALIHDPSIWLNTTLPMMLDACQKRATEILIGLPNPSDPAFEHLAQSIGLDGATLKSNIEIVVQSTENQWKARTANLDAKSAMRLVAYQGISMYEIVAVDNLVICMLSQALGHSLGDYPMVFTFEQEQQSYPSAWLREALKGLSGQNEYWASKTP